MLCVDRALRADSAHNVQACARQILGFDPVELPHYYLSDPLCKWNTEPICRVSDTELRYKYKYENCKDQWFLDAFTVDPKDLAEIERGIWLRGKAQPINVSLAENASVMGMPTMMVYIAAHPKFGTSRSTLPKAAGRRHSRATAIGQRI